MKKLTSVTLALFMLLGLAACGGTNSSSTASSAAPSSDAGASSAASQGGTEFENKELSIAIFEGGYGSAYWETVVKMFEEAYPGVKVNMQISPTIGDIIRPQIVAGNVPDFISMSDNDQTGLITSMIKENALLDITDVFDGPGLEGDGPLRDQILAGALESGKCSPYGDGKVFLAPFTTSPIGLVYNKELFKTKGWEVPVTWDEFFALGDKAKEDGRALFTYQGIYPSYLETVLYPAITSSAGMEQLKKVTSYAEGAWDNEKVIGVMANLQKISKGGYLMEGTVALNHTQSQTDMMVGKALFIPNGIWMESEMAEAPREDGFTFGMAPTPVVEKGDTRYILTGIDQLSIPAKAKNPELAKEFLRFLYTDASVKLFTQESNGMFALKRAYSLVKDDMTEGLRGMFSVYEEPGTVSLVVGFDAMPPNSKINVQDEIFNPISDIMNGAMTPEQWAANLEKVYAEIRAAK